MPSAKDPSPDFFDDDTAIATQLDTPFEPEQEFAFAAPAPSTKKGKKKNKKDKNKAQTEAYEEEAGPYGTSTVPPPPKDDGVKLGEDFSREGGPAQPVEENGAFRDPVDADPTPYHAPPPASQPPAPVKSPRLAQAKPTQAARTPPSRPTSLCSPPQQYSGIPSHRPNSSAAQLPSLARRESATHTSPRPRFVDPVAPPHKPQPHFYGLPDFGLSFGQQRIDQAGSGKAAGSSGYCCTFDSFANSGDAASAKKAKDALLVGSEGGLEVFRVLPNKFEVVGRLEGLRGSIIGAKILPYLQRDDSTQPTRPLVAVVVHGAAADEKVNAIVEDDVPTHYQTTVEVYSLQDQTHVATLYRSSPVAVEKPTLGHLASLPDPVGDLRIAAEGKYVLVASGKSGEILVFSNAATAQNLDEQFRCLGKFWTTVQLRTVTPASRPQSSSEGGQAVEDKDDRPRVPLFSLGQPWLALLAPLTSSHVSIGGSPHLLDDSPLPPGLASHVALPQPPVSCDIAGVDSEGTWSRVTRQAAQGLVKYSQLGFEMGRQGWRELTNPASQTGTQHSRGASREHDAFPPTMAPADDPTRLMKEPAIVSIIDLDTLLEAEELKPKYSPAPLATFALQDGCNFLSLSSNGLRLLCVSRSGKVSTVWDLAQSCHGTTRHDYAEEDNESLGPCVKQIHRFERNSEAIVTEAAWSRDDDMLAVLTSHGTVHLHEVPARSSRKRKRRSTLAALPAPEKAQPTVSVSQGMSPPSTNGGWMGSLRSGFQQMSTQVNSSVRTQSSMPTFSRPTFAGFREITATAGQAGGRAIAKGLSQGYTVAKGGVGDMWHNEDNKIRHATLRDVGGYRALRWIRRQSGSSLAIVCGGFVHLHPVQPFSRRKGEQIVTGLKHDRHRKETFALPLIRTSAEGAGQKKDACASEGPHGFWSLRLTPGVDDRAGSAAPPPPQQENEIETNPPYCPFHVDPRVSIFAFDGASPGSEDAALFHLHGHGLEGEDEEAWVFGAALPESTKMNTVEHRLPELGGAEDSEEELMGQVESRLTIRGEEEVRLHTRPRGRGEERGEFEVLLDEDDGM